MLFFFVYAEINQGQSIGLFLTAVRIYLEIDRGRTER